MDSTSSSSASTSSKCPDCECPMKQSSSSKDKQAISAKETPPSEAKNASSSSSISYAFLPSSGPLCPDVPIASTVTVEARKMLDVCKSQLGIDPIYEDIDSFVVSEKENADRNNMASNNPSETHLSQPGIDSKHSIQPSIDSKAGLDRRLNILQERKANETNPKEEPKLTTNNTTVRVFSLNIACAARDEQKCPLAYRLPVLLKFLRHKKKELDFDILCLQELRPTGQLSVRDILSAIEMLLGMEYVYHKVNPSEGAFGRATFFRSDRWVHLETTVYYTNNSKSPEFPYMFMWSQFTVLNSKHTDPTFSVGNVHAPAVPIGGSSEWSDKESYYSTVLRLAESDGRGEEWKIPSILIGDMNKFKEETEEYHEMIKEAGFVDLISPSTMTFQSFPHDPVQCESSLDAVLVQREYASKCTASVHSTLEEEIPTNCSISANLEPDERQEEALAKPRILDIYRRCILRIPSGETADIPVRPTDHYGILTQLRLG